LSFSTIALAADVEVKPIIKGSLRDLYPGASVVHNEITYNVWQGQSFGKDLDLVLQQRTSMENWFKTYAYQQCEKVKSRYAVIDNFVLNVAYSPSKEGGLLITADGNVVCFNLPTPSVKKP